MPRLRVSVALGSRVIEDRLCSVRDAMWLGDSVNARVAFPGGRVRVERRGPGFWVQGFPLDPKTPLHLHYGQVHVVLEHVEVERHARDWSGLPDPKMALLTLAALLMMAFYDTVGVAEDLALGSQVSAVQAGPSDVPPDAGRYPEAYDTGLAPDHWPPVVTFTTD